MNRKLKQICMQMALAVMLTAALSIQSFAANAKIAFSDPSTETGSEFSVTMKFTSTSGEVLGNTDVMLSYDASAIEFLGGSENASGGSGAIRVTSGMTGSTEVATVLKFRALKAGTTGITIASWEGYDSDGQMLTMDHEGSSTITITAGAGAAALSNDAGLSSLQVSPGTLDPAFSPQVKAYQVSVGLDVNKLTVSAAASNEKASVAVEGGTELQPGTNTVVCRVTAEDGTTVQEYVITVNKVEGGASGEAGQSGETTSVSDSEILAQLEASKTSLKIGILPIPEDAKLPAGLKESTITIGDTRVQGWTQDGEGQPEFCIFYGVSADGALGFYRYDMTEKTLQRYFEYSSDGAMTPEYLELAAKHNELVDDYNRMRILAVVAAAVALILLAVLLLMLTKTGKQQKPVARRQEEPKFRPRPEGKVSRTAGGRMLTKEERYMMGEEDEYEEDEYKEEDALDYMPQMAASQMPEKERGGLWEEDREMADTNFYEPEPDTDRKTEAVEQLLAEDLAKEASEAAENPDHDADDEDFEILDL